MPINASALFARLAADEDNVSVARNKALSRRVLAEAEQAGYDLAVYHSLQKAHNSMSACTSQTARERLVREYADAKRALARFMASLRSKAQARSEIAEHRVAELTSRAQANNDDALDQNEEQRLQKPQWPP